MPEQLLNALKKKKDVETKQQEAVINILFTNELFQHRFGQFFRKHGINQAQYHLLRVLKDADAPLPSLEIADRMITVVPAITSSIHSLQKKGLVARKRSEQDRRVFYVSLTVAGKRLLAKMAKPHQKVHGQLLGHMTKKQFKQLVELLEIARGDLTK